MPTGNHVSEKEKERILGLKTQGLTHKVIAIRFGLRQDTIRKIIKKEERKDGRPL